MWPVLAPTTMHQCCLPGLVIHQNEPARQRARELASTFFLCRCALANSSVLTKFFLAAVAQNIKRLVRFLSQPTMPLCNIPPRALKG